MEAVLLFGVFVVLTLIGVPIGTALGISGMLALSVFDLGFNMAGVNFVSGISSFPLLAIPFFVLAGVILDRAGLARVIAHFFELLVGRTTGGLAIVGVLTCMFWGAMSGSGPATTAAVGLILIAPMLKHGYSRDFSAAMIANASDLSIIIPPSIAFIIFGNITGASVGALFLGGIFPGILMGMALIAVACFISRKRGYRGLEERGTPGEILRAFLKSFWALLAPVIILGGIYTGVFVPTEAAVVAVFYSLFVGLVVYRSIRLKDIVGIFVEATVTTSVIMFVVAFAGIFSWAASTTGIIDGAAHLIVSISPNAVMMILLVNLLLLVLGMFLDAISISYLVMPLLIPVLGHYNIDPVWYGVIFICALAIGQATPPVGVNLFTAANLAETDMDGVARESIPFVLAAVVVLIVISLIPALSLYLPQIAGVHAGP
ncbi:MAG: TRAP transporter large permease [Verrucomicrobia bacterium]|nr:TRAP transporter large permease [Verrucomicrobiota bacterium]